MLKPSDLDSLTLLGQGPGTRVWRGLDTQGQILLLKTFSLADAPDWKAQELFEREAQVLQQLDHPSLPRLLAYGTEAGQSYLIYPFIAGESLQARLNAGWRPDLTEVLGLIRQLLETLVWLHDRQPPLIHRDIKPSNLILTADHELFLIDFGSVLRHLKPSGGSTVAGTFGYMAPEQLTGRALPASDLYAVGATLIHLLSGRAPAELPHARLWIQFEDHVQLAPALKTWIRTLIDPVLEERCPDARRALLTLEQALKAPVGLTTQTRPSVPAALLAPQPEPGQSAIQVQTRAEGLEILLPSRVLVARPLQQAISGAASWVVLMVLFNKIFSHFASPQLSLFYLYAVLGLITVGSALLQLHRQRRLALTPTRLLLTPTALKIEPLSETAPPLEIPWTRIRRLRQRRRQGLSLRYVDAFGRRHRMRLGHGLAPQEQAWLAGTLLAQQHQQESRLSGGEADALEQS